MDEFEDSDELRDAVIAAAWRKVAGSSLCSHTTALGTKDTTLEVAVRDNIWKRHLESLSGQMIFKINSLLGHAAVTYISFRIDEEAVEWSESDGESSAAFPGFEKAAEEEKTGELLDASAKIKDPILRGLFIDAAASCLVRQRIRSISPKS